MGSTVSAIVVYMENLEHKMIATVPDNCKPSNCQRIVDDVICLVHTGEAEELQHHINTLNPTGSIRFTRKEDNNRMLFLDASVTRNGGGSVKSTVYRLDEHKTDVENNTKDLKKGHIPPPTSPPPQTTQPSRTI